MKDVLKSKHRFTMKQGCLIQNLMIHFVEQQLGIIHHHRK